jgi:hypothetical protein
MKKEIEDKTQRESEEKKKMKHDHSRESWVRYYY